MKPEYWMDGKIRRLSDSSALFFIALWNFADDYGFFVCDTLELSLRCPRWRPQSLHKMLCSLSVHGLIRVCWSLHVAQIVSWEHQKIKDRRASKWNGVEIKWDDVPINAQGSDRKRPVLDRIVKDSKGEELRKGEASPPTLKAPDGLQSVIALYCELWKSKYNSPRSPDLGGKEIGILRRLLKEHGEPRTRLLLEAYLQMPDSWFLTKTHDLATLSTNKAKVSLFADSGKMVTRREVQHIDDSLAIANQLRRIREEGS